MADASMPLHPLPGLGTTPEGEIVHPRPLWLALFGPCQEEWPLRAVVQAYFQRSHQEHGHRFLKRNLLVTAYQTPDVGNMERIIGQLGTPARRLQPRGKPRGQPKGMRLAPRARQKVVRKGASQGSSAASRLN